MEETTYRRVMVSLERAHDDLRRLEGEDAAAAELARRAVWTGPRSARREAEKRVDVLLGRCEGYAAAALVVVQEQQRIRDEYRSGRLWVSRERAR